MWKRHRRFSTDRTWDRIHARLVEADAAGEVDWQTSVDSTINRAHQHATNLGRVERPTGLRGAESNYMTRASTPAFEPVDHGLGRSRGGLSTKIHQLVDGRGYPLVIAVTAGQAGDSPMLRHLLADLAVARLGRPGRPRTRPEAVLGDKAYSSRSNRALLRSKRIKTVIPQPADQVAHRQRRGATGGRPPDFDAETYKDHNVVERSFNDYKQWRGLATRYDKLATTYRGAAVLRAALIWLRQ